LRANNNSMKVLIGEDDILIAEHLRDILTNFEYEVVAVAHKKELIIEAIDRTNPDLALLDIRMKGKYDGIEIGEYVLKNYNFPVIYITAHSDANIVKKALKTKPAGYITKPFQPIGIFTAIQIAVESFKSRQENNTLTVKEGYKSIKIPYFNILFLKSDNIYVEIHTTNKKYVERITLEKILTRIESKNFIRIHRSYAVNIDYVKEFFSNKLKLEDFTLPVSRKYREEIKKYRQN